MKSRQAVIRMKSSNSSPRGSNTSKQTPRIDPKDHPSCPKAPLVVVNAASSFDITSSLDTQVQSIKKSDLEPTTAFLSPTFHNPSELAELARKNRNMFHEPLKLEPRYNQFLFCSTGETNPLKALEFHGHLKLRSLGKGGQGTVDLVRKVSNGLVYVRKTILNYKSPYADLCDTETHLLRDVLPHNKRIIKYYGAVHAPVNNNPVPFGLIYTELCHFGDLDDFCRRAEKQRSIPALKHDPIPAAWAWHVFLCMVESLAFIHHGVNSDWTHYDTAVFDTPKPPENWKPVFHRDFKPANIMIRYCPKPRGKNGVLFGDLVLGDFGFASTKREKNRSGTLEFQPPESGKEDADEAADIWALGSVLHFMGHYRAAAVEPYAGKRTKSSSRRRQEIPKEARWIQKITQIDPILDEAMRFCLKWDRKQRPTALELLEKYGPYAHNFVWKRMQPLPAWMFPMEIYESNLLMHAQNMLIVREAEEAETTPAVAEESTHGHGSIMKRDGGARGERVIIR